LNNCFIAADPKPSRPLQFRKVDLLTPNANEAIAMAGMDPHSSKPIDWTEVCQKIYAKHEPKFLVVTMGAKGMLIAKDGQAARKIIPTCAREVFDVSGAGDTVIAAMTVALATGHDLEEAAQFANIAAGIVVGKLGTAVAMPAEILNFYRQHSSQ
jgi:D-beta-D-heptose 7-phosphate kinase/D-beta-D-heptose 1-phosphate adenosyltransferase